MRLLARLAPVSAGLVLVVAGLGRLAGWPAWVALSVLGVAVLSFLAAFLVLRREHAVSDALAACIDADAGLGGELRSAHWFAERVGGEDWPAFHLERAAARLGTVAWNAVYPPVRATREWGLTLVLVAAAVVLTLRFPAPMSAVSPGTLLEGAAAEAGVELPPDLARQLDELLAQAQAGTLSAKDAKALTNLDNLLDKLDPKKNPQLADLAKQIKDAANALASDTKVTPDDAAQAREAAPTPDDLKQAMEDLASRLATARTGERADSSANAAANSDAGQFGKASAKADAQQATQAEAKVQVVREASSDPGRGQAMLGGGGAMGGDSSAGRGGNAGGRGNAAGQTQKAESLKQELIEASADAQGQNVTKEDLRRKTEQGKSGLAYTRAAAASTVDRSRAVPPPPVPDARRALVQSYFLRQIIR